MKFVHESVLRTQQVDQIADYMKDTCASVCTNLRAYEKQENATKHKRYGVTIQCDLYGITQNLHKIIKRNQKKTDQETKGSL